MQPPLRTRKNSKGQYYPMTDLRQRPSGEPIIFDWQRPKPSRIDLYANWFIYFILSLLILALIVYVLYLISPVLLGGFFGIIWVRGKHQARKQQAGRRRY